MLLKHVWMPVSESDRPAEHWPVAGSQDVPPALQTWACRSDNPTNSPTWSGICQEERENGIIWGFNCAEPPHTSCWLTSLWERIPEASSWCLPSTSCRKTRRCKRPGMEKPLKLESHTVSDIMWSWWWFFDQSRTHPGRRSPTEELRRTRHRSVWCTPDRRWSPEPST